MEGSLKELIEYRLARAKEMLAAAQSNLEIGQYKTSLNRSYYAVFHAMRSANALKGYDSSKHSGVIAFFYQRIFKNGSSGQGTGGNHKREFSLPRKIGL